MIYFFVTFLSILMFFLIDIYDERQYRCSKFLLKYRWLLCSIPFIIVSSMRYKVGTDYLIYTDFYYNNSIIGTSRGIEILFSLVLTISKFLNFPILIIIFFSVSTNLFIFKAIEDQSINVKISILLFLLTGTFNWSLNIMRQTLCLAIFLYSLKFIKDKEFLKYMLMITVAVLFHKTSILYYPVYFLLLFAKSKYNYILLMVSLLLFLFNQQLRMIFIYISNYFNFYDNYFNRQYDLQIYSFSLIVITGMLVLISLMTINKWKNDRQGILYFRIQYLAFVFSILSNIIPNNSRIIYMFMPIAIISVPYFLSKLQFRTIQLTSTLNKIPLAIFFNNSNNMKNIIWVSTVFLFFVFYIHFFVIQNQGGTFPYQFLNFNFK